MKDIVIGGRAIGPEHQPFIIAEMSGNHNHSLDRAMKIVEAAADAGAHALKLQTYTADTITLDINEGEFRIEDPSNPWKGNSLYELYEKAHTPWEWHRLLLNRCRELGMIGFSTPFDATAVDFLEALDVPCHKVASFENIDLPLIRKIAGTGKPVIMSTGMATVAQLDEAIRVLRTNGCSDVILLKCTSSYPATPEGSNVSTITHLRDLFRVQVGLSDHTLGLGVALAAITLGATVVEKHFTLDRADGGVDSTFSMESAEMKMLVTESERAWQSLGKITYGLTGEEEGSMLFRRSLYVCEDMKAGDRFTKKNLRSIRPGHGLPPRYYDIFLGKLACRDVKRGTPLSWDLIGEAPSIPTTVMAEEEE